MAKLIGRQCHTVFFVVALCCSEFIDAEADFRDAEASASDDVAGGHETEAYGFHIGVQSLSPMMASYQALTSLHRASSEFVSLWGKAVWYTDYEVMSILVDHHGFNVRWSARYYRLIESQALVGAFQPGSQDARAYSELIRFWLGQASWTRTQILLRLVMRACVCVQAFLS